ncbi:MAG: ATP-binding protein [Nibricoccus sp.]
MAKTTLMQLALAAVAQRVGVQTGTDSTEANYLAEQARGLPDTSEGLADLARQILRKPSGDDTSLVRLASTWKLSLAETLSLALVAAIERDLLAGRAIAYAQTPVGGSRPTLGLLAESFGRIDNSKLFNPVQLASSPAFLSGALTLHNDGAPLPERPVSLSLPLCLALSGEETNWPGGVIDHPDAQLPLPESVVAQCRQQASALSRESSCVLVLRSSALEETRAAATSIARTLNKRPFIAETVATSGLAAWLILRDLIPVFVLEPGPGETKQVPAIPLYDGPVLVAAGIEGTLEAPGRQLTHWSLPLPTLAERETLWRQALPHGTAAAELSRSHRLSTARISQLGKLALHRAHLDGRTTPDATTVRDVSRSGEGAGLESLAQLIADPIPDDALVLHPELRAELDALLSRCHHRDGLTSNLGAASATRYTAGVRALFVGPSGTGKTLAACWLATRLGLPLYRVDLANINSKYIGETEKNLARLLARAERTEAVLLFDEADSLFGKRTDVRESNDRFANAQTNYLLQRIETFDSIAILTSNSRARFDNAFSRRLDLIVEFPLPAPAERRALWQAHLGEAHSLTMQELNLLAGQCDFAGGQIRNVVLTAAVAARGNGQIIDFAKLLHALQAEYRKVSRPIPPALVAQKPPMATVSARAL